MERVLVVDDGPENLKFVVNHILKPNGYQPLTADDGEEGFHVALEESPDLILLNLQMPKMDGFQVLKALHDKGRNIPVILMTFQDTEELAAQVFRMGVKDCVIKPFQIGDLLAAMERALAEDRLRRERDTLTQQLIRANHQLERRVKELDTLSRIGKAVTALLDLGKLLNRLVEAAVYITGAEGGVLLLVDEDTDELCLRAAQGVEEKTARNLCLKVKDSAASQAIQTGRPVIVDGKDLKSNVNDPIKASIYVPIKVKDEVIGVLGVNNSISDERFGQPQMNMLSALAAYAAIAIENARLFGAAEGERRKLETVLANTEDAVILVEEGDAQQVMLANRAARRTFGMPDDVTGRALAEVIDNGALADLFRRAKGGTQFARAEISVRDGRTLNVHVTSIPGVGRVAVMQDITHLKELDRMKSDFVAAVSHDLRSPLTSIKGFADLLSVVGPLNEQQQSFLGKIRRGVDAITDLISDLLDLGRIETGVNLEMEPCDLGAIVEKTVESLRSHANLRKQSLHKHIVLDLPPVSGNPVRLDQAVSNLISNAIKYTPQGGRISVSVTSEDGQVVVTVKDNGIGISPDDLQHIFDKFYRVKSKETEEISGSGLGLSIVKSIIDKHRGRIWVSSQEGAGSTFVFVLPAIQ
jgi:two-component system NtrC family sensor kinase